MYIDGPTVQVLAAFGAGLIFGYTAHLLRRWYDRTWNGVGVTIFDIEAMEKLADSVGTPDNVCTLNYACSLLGMLAHAESEGNVILIHNPDKPEETIHVTVRNDG